MEFRTVLLQNGKTATGIEVPNDVVVDLGSGRKPAVRVTINGYTYRSTVATMDSVFMIPVSAEHRSGAGIAAGDEVAVSVELDTEPRELAVPPDFATALDQDAAARQVFDALSYSNRRRHGLSIEGAKTPETRQRRIEKAIATLREGTP